MVPLLDGIRNVDILEAGKIYDYGSFSASPIKLYHDVDNFGYRIFKDGYKIIHCTDTSTLEGIEAKNYDIYAIEHNYDEDTIFEKIKQLKEVRKFAYQDGAINTHLSEQAARDFIYRNAGSEYEVVRLHESSILK
jgi:hypothetical protein